MKNLPEKVIIYDNNCPMCSLYTDGFVKWRLLEKQNRVSFADLNSTALSCKLDLQRARHEIPLIDLRGGKTLYGLDALLFIIGSKIPFIHCLFQFKPIHAFWACLYDIISYNRRIIVPAKLQSGEKDYAPDLSIKHRLFFIGISLLFSSLLFYKFANFFNYHLQIPQGSLQMMSIATSGWLIQIVIGLAFLKCNNLDYTGHLSVILLIGSLVLLPGIMADAATGYQYMSIPVMSLLFSSIIMVWQHFIRVRHLQMNQNLTLSWILILFTSLSFWMYLFCFNN